MKPRNPQQSERPRETGTASIWSVTLSAVSILTVTEEVGSFLMRNAARNSLSYQKELQVVKNQQLDLVNFETNMQEFKDAFGRNYRIASEKFQTAIEEIDKTIDHLEKVKKALQSSENNLRLANDKADDLSIKKLTKNAPSVRQMFDDLKEDGE